MDTAHPGILRRLERFILSILPAWIYFSVMIALLRLTQTVLLAEYGIRHTNPTLVIGAAFVIARVLHLSRRFRFINRFADKPLVYSVLWKTLIYFLTYQVFQFARSMLRALLKGQSTEISVHRALTSMSGARFLIIQLWLAVLLLVYVISTELVQALGKKHLFELFFGPLSKGPVETRPSINRPSYVGPAPD